jgi:hypothetical protein
MSEPTTKFKRAPRDAAHRASTTRASRRATPARRVAQPRHRVDRARRSSLVASSRRVVVVVSLIDLI